MTVELLRQTLESKFITVMTAQHPTVYRSFENVKYDPPVDGTLWAHFVIVEGGRRRANIGTSRRYRHEGVINIAVMSREDSGTREVNLVLDTLSKYLDDLTLAVAPSGSVTLYGGEIRNRGVINGYYTKNFMGEFRYDYPI